MTNGTSAAGDEDAPTGKPTVAERGDRRGHRRNAEGSAEVERRMIGQPYGLPLRQADELRGRSLRSPPRGEPQPHALAQPLGIHLRPDSIDDSAPS